MKFFSIFILITICIFSGKKNSKEKNCESFLETYHSPKELTKKPFVKINFKLSEFYPKKAKEKNIRSGESTIQVFIDKKGKLSCSKIIKKSEGYGFDEAAKKIVSKANYKPGQINNKAVNSYVVFPIKFSLDE